MEDQKLLVDSEYCRLCGEENKNGTSLFPINETDQDLSQLVNKYLPLKVFDDGKLPKTICPGCHIQLEASIQFLDLIINGQTKIRHLWRIQQENLRKLERERKQKELDLTNTLTNGENAGETYVLQTEENGDSIYIHVFNTDGNLFAPDHEMSLRAEGLERPRRKRGRPPKPPPKEEDDTLQKEEQPREEEEPEDETEVDADGRKRRKIKVPTRFKEAVQGKELERIFREEGVIGEEESSSEEDEDENGVHGSGNEQEDEVIGHLENQAGEDLGELIIANKNKKMSRQKGKRRKKFDCEICNRSFLHYGRFVAHKSLHKDVKYECNTCKEQFLNREDLEQHQLTENHVGEMIIEKLVSDNESENLQMMPMTTADAIIEEALTSTDDVNILLKSEFICSFCTKTFTSKNSLDIHTRTLHEGQTIFGCEKCNKTFISLASLSNHVEQQHGENKQNKTDKEKGYYCDICNKHFNHPSSIIYHKESEHNNGRRFVCNKCDKSFKHKQLLQRHQLVHSDNRPYACKSCGATFKTRANLINHQPTHTGEKKYFCVKCGQQFAHKTSLTLHYRWHAGQKPYECNVCNKSFSQKGNLQEHKRIHTGEKPFCCDHCGRKFTTSSQFKLHVKRHTGERPWQCEYCKKTFLHKDTWKCHTRRHRNERPFQCTTCNRGFTEQWALKKHMRLHTGEKPYVCEICNKAFADCSNLTKHRKIHLGHVQMRKSNTLQAIQSNGETQYYYVAYQDSNSNDGQTFVQFLSDSATVPEAEIDQEKKAPESPQLGLDYSLLQSVVDTDVANMDELDNTIMKPDDDLEVEEGYFQVTDQDGNPISITTNDGQQIKVTTADGQNLNGLLPDGTMVPLRLTHDGKAVALHLLDENVEEESSVVVANNSSDPLTSPPTNDLTEDTQFVTDDGKNVCLIASYSMEDDAMTPEYLSIT